MDCNEIYRYCFLELHSGTPCVPRSPRESSIYAVLKSEVGALSPCNLLNYESVLKILSCSFLEPFICGGKLFRDTSFVSARWMENMPSAIVGFISRCSLPPI